MPFRQNNFKTRQAWNVLEDQEIYIGLIMAILEQKAGISTLCSTHTDVNIISIRRVG